MDLIIDKWTLEQKVIRIAYEILEEHIEEKEICLVGIQKGGFHTADLLKKAIEKIDKRINVSVHSIKISKDSPLNSEYKLSTNISYFNHKLCIIVDDVANSGRTLFYAYKPFLEIEPNGVKVAVLVDRKHKRFPVHCDYVGTSLATTIKEHIKVVFKNNEVEAAYLE